MLRTQMVAYPWDLPDRELEGILDRLHSELGVTGVSLWMTTPSLTHLRTRDAKPRTFRTRGGLFFAPDEQMYRGTRCKLQTSSWLKGRNPLGNVADACSRRDMNLRVILSASRAGRLVERHPEMACKNVLGDESKESLCLQSPDVQAYLEGLVTDLDSNHHPSAIVLDAFDVAWSEARYLGLSGSAALGSVERALLSLCFCESCHQSATSAGVNVEAVRESVASKVCEALTSGRGSSAAITDVLAADSSLSAYMLWRTEELSALARRLLGRVSVPLILRRELKSKTVAQLPGPDGGLFGGVVTSVADFEAIGSAILPSCRQNELSLALGCMADVAAADVVQAFSYAARLGFVGVDIDHFGQIPDSALTPIKQAIRKTRRDAGVA